MEIWDYFLKHEHYNRTRHASRSRQLVNGIQEANMPFVVELRNGSVWEAQDPLSLCDVLLDWDLREISKENWFLMLMMSLERIMLEMARDRTRVQVYDSRGLLFDNSLDHQEALVDVMFKNMDDPLQIDARNPWTTIASLIKINYITLYEKYPLFSKGVEFASCDKCLFHHQRADNMWCDMWDKKSDAVYYDIEPLLDGENGGCVWATDAIPYDDYQKVEPAKLTY